MRVSEIRVKRIRVNQGLGSFKVSSFMYMPTKSLIDRGHRTRGPWKWYL